MNILKNNNQRGRKYNKKEADMMRNTTISTFSKTDKNCLLLFDFLSYTYFVFIKSRDVHEQR